MQGSLRRSLRGEGGRKTSRAPCRRRAASSLESPGPASLPRRSALCTLLSCAAVRPLTAAALAAGDVEDAPSYFTPPTRVTAPGRVVAIGDLHGDLAQVRRAHLCSVDAGVALVLLAPGRLPSHHTPQTTRALQLAGVIGLEDNRAVWTGGNTTLVQMGDIVDRGDEEIGARELLGCLRSPLRLPSTAARRSSLPLAAAL